VKAQKNFKFHFKNIVSLFFVPVFCGMFLAIHPFLLMAEQGMPEQSQPQTENNKQPQTVSETKETQEGANQSAEQVTQGATQTEASQNFKVMKIEIHGNRVVSTQTILNKMKTREGSELTQFDINEDIKRLYGAGYFEDIRIDMEDVSGGGVKLIVTVDEKPMVRHIMFAGNKILKDRDIRKEFGVIEGQVFDEFAVQQGINKIKGKYASKGFRFISVKYSVETDSATKEVTIKILVDEGKKFLIREIKFEGNQSFKSRKLEKTIKTHARNLMFFRFGVFDEEKFKGDLDRLSSFYQQNGFLDVQVSQDIDYDEKTQKILIKIQVEEGKQYRTGHVYVKGVTVLPENEIWQRLNMLPGSVYSQQGMAEEVQTIRKFYSEHGYMDVRVLPDVNLNKETGKVDVTYQLTEGDLYFIDKVMIRGNTKTKDIVIRRELRVRPGEKYDGVAVERSKQRLENLGYFEEITYDTEPSSVANRKDIVFRVKEKRTGELSFGAGISSIDQFIGFAEIAQRNFDLLNWPRFTGGGQNVSLRGRFGSITRDFGFSFEEPYLFNKPISAGLDLYDIRNENRNVDFKEQRLGAGVTFSRAFMEFLRAGFGYKMENVNLFDVESDASNDVKMFEGDRWLSRLKLFFNCDKRDNVMNPTKGWMAGISGELIGTFLGGSEDYYITQVNATKYWSFLEGKHVIEFQNRFGVSGELGSDIVPPFDRFFAGGLGTVRGYNYRRVGPIEGGDAIGGQTMYIANLEYTFPLPYIGDIVKAATFIDVGNLNRDTFSFGFDDFAVSIGPGVKVKTPIGPLALYYGFPIMNRDVKDEWGRFEFSLSRSF